MSPRTSEIARRTAAIEALVCRDVGRKTADLIAASAGGLNDAAQALAGARGVGLITGFFVPRDGVVAWQSCIDAPAANRENVAVNGWHWTMLSNPQTLRIVAERLALPESHHRGSSS